MSNDLPPPAALLTGTLMCIEAVVDALIARDPGMAVAIEERLDELLMGLAPQAGTPPGVELPARILRTALQSKARMRRQAGAKPNG